MRLSEKLANSPSSKLSKAVKSKKDIKAILDKYSYTDDIDAWVSRNPEALLSANTGICFDTAALQDKLLSDLGITHRNMFAVSKDSLSGKNYTDPSHTFVLHKDTDGLWKWLEGSWEPYRHNKLSAKTSNKLAKQIKKLMEKDNGKSYTLHSIEKYPEEGLPIGEYYMRLLSQAKKSKKHNEKKASFADVKSIYDSLPEDQRRLVSPRGRFVDSPNLQLRVLNGDKTGFAEAYKLNGEPKDSAFVTLAVSPEAQGKGVGKEVLQQLIARAKAMRIKKLIYRLASENDASRALVRKFVDKPSKIGKDFEEYTIDPTSVKDPYEVELPKGIAEAVEDVKEKYKDLGYDLSDIGAKGSTRSRYESGAVTPFSVMPKKLQVGASWVPNDNSVYFNPDLKAAMKLYGVKGTEAEFARALAAHELAHAVDQRYTDKETRKKLIQEAKDSGFTTPYLEALPFEENRDKEIFAEWLAHKITKGK